jgi:hypothetical protein
VLCAVQCLLALAPDSALLVELDEAGAVVGQREVAAALIHQGVVLKVGGCPGEGGGRAGGWRGGEMSVQGPVWEGKEVWIEARTRGERRGRGRVRLVANGGNRSTRESRSSTRDALT